MARPLKYTEEYGRQITDRLRAGCTKKAAVESLGIAYTTFLRWIVRNDSFATAVTHAEAEAEVRNTALLEKAAQGWDGGSTTRTTKTVYKTRKTTHPDGRVVEEPVALQEVTEATTTERLYDWRAALEWLKRRRRDEWGDGLEVKVSRMGEDELRNYILGRAVPVEPGAVESGGDRAALGPGAGYPVAADED